MLMWVQEVWVGNDELVQMYDTRLGDAGYVNFKLARTNNRGDGNTFFWFFLKLALSFGYFYICYLFMFVWKWWLNVLFSVIMCVMV